uniref:Uncharacterized LOC105928481 n=1 Tax=Fundulus heteroclitus TaxID=8078 RepID=A0A3Q2R172_FUNHE
MDFLHPSTSENIPQKTSGRFTVRSANSPSYSLTRSPGMRKRQTAQSVKGTNGANKKEDIGVAHQTELNQNGTAERKHLENGTDVGGTPTLYSQGRTEGRRCNLTSRSMNLSWKAGVRDPPQNARAGTSTLLGKRAAGDFKEPRTENKNISIGRTCSLKGFKYAGPSHTEGNSSVNQDFADRASKVSSHPVKFRSESPPQAVQSIQERIQKLFESAGETAVGGTFPRRFSSSDDYNPVGKTMASILAQKKVNHTSTETLVPPEIVEFNGRSTANLRQGQLNSKYLEEDKWGSETLDMGTKSLDRFRSRNTAAARIRSARAAAGMSQSQTIVGDTSSTFQQKGAIINQEDCRADTTERFKVQGRTKERDEETKQQTELKRGIKEGDVFETNPGKGTLQSTERDMLSESRTSSASVRNKISQFEALTQRATRQVQMSRRTFSVPTQLHKAQEGVKKSGSAKDISERSDKWETNKDSWIEKRKNTGAERSLSVDETGISLGKSETAGSNLFDKSKNNLSGDLGKYSSLKKKLQIPLNERAQPGFFCFDETDFIKHSPAPNIKDSNIKDMTMSTVSLTHGSDMQPWPPCEISSPVSDDEKTPTNTPLNTSPFLSPVKEPETIFPFGDNTGPPVIGQENTHKDRDSTLLPPTALSQNSESDVFITHENKTKDKDSPHLPPDRSSKNNWPEVFNPNVKTELPKGRKQLTDLKAWIAGLDPDYKCWDEYMQESEDDDESTQKDNDSNYDSDSGDSSVTITSNISQSDNRSFSVSLSELCSFSGADNESDNDSDDWELSGRRSVSVSSDVSVFSCVSLLPAEELDKLIDGVKNLGDETLQDCDDVNVVVLHKEVGVGLGFSLAGGVDQNKPITVHRVFNSGVAAQEGSIREGDKVLSINGTALSKSTHSEALKILRKTKSEAMAVVVLRKGDLRGASKLGVLESNETETTTQYETGQRVCVQLQKKSSDLGFSLHGGVGSSEGNRPLTVQYVFQGGPRDKVFSGDEILEIQGINVVKMTRLTVWTFIKTLASGPVEVVLRRPSKLTQS